MKRKIYNQLLDWKNNRKGYTTHSLNKCAHKFKEYITTPTILHPADLKVDADGKRYLPLYMTPLL